MTIKEAENKYQEYLSGHIGNVSEALDLLKTLDISFVNDNYERLQEICKQHDASKYSDDEYEPYREHFYPINDEEKLKTESFELAVRHHIKNNKHHWDYWIDESYGGLSIPDEYEYLLYSVERCCDWLAMACQHDEVSNAWYNANRSSIMMPNYAWQLCDEIMSKVPEKCDFSFKGTRGKLDEEDEYDLRSEIIRLKGKNYLDGIDKKSKGHAGYYALKRIVDNISKETKENGLKQGDIDVSSKEYKNAMNDYNKQKKTKHVHYDASYETDESNEAKDAIRKELGESMSYIDKKNTIIKMVEDAEDDEIPYVVNKMSQIEYNNELKLDDREFILSVIQNNYKVNPESQSDIDNNYNIECAICSGLHLDSEEYLDHEPFKLNESFNIIRGDNGYLIEANMRQLKRKTLSEDPTRAKKSKHVQSKYIGISKYGVLNFETTSETHSGVKWYQEVHFPSFVGFMNIVEQGDEIDAEDVKKAMSSDNIKISCFTEDIEVQTLDGMKKIKDIKVGDKVLTHTGKYQEVIQTFENDYSGEMIEINGVKSTPNHPYLVKLPNGDIEWKMACEITKDMKLLAVEE